MMILRMIIMTTHVLFCKQIEMMIEGILMTMIMIII